MIRLRTVPSPVTIVAALLAVLIPAGALAAESKLSGDLFVTMQSGDVKRGADVLVAVLPASRAFMDEWEQVQQAYEQEVAPVVTEYDRLDAQQKSLGSPADTRDLRGSLQRTQASIQVLNQMMQIGRTQWAPLQDKYTKATLEVIAKHTTTTTRTDVNGHYEVLGLQPGAYLVYAKHSVFKSVLYWLVPVDVQGDSKLSLSNSNAKRNSLLRGRMYN